MGAEVDTRIRTLAQWLNKSQYPVIFTGAGVSTESGIPDFRGPDGLWTRKEKGLAEKPMRDWDSVDPNKGHMAVVELQKLGKVKFLISQNVDNLHLKSGVNPDLLAELHGNITKRKCVKCGKKLDRSVWKKTCECGGKMKSSVVDFGDSLPERDLRFSYQHSQKSDLFIVLGSSLLVTPAADMPWTALQAGARLVIINQGDTPYDSQADLRFGEAIGDVLPRAVKELKNIMGVK